MPQQLLNTKPLLQLTHKLRAQKNLKSEHLGGFVVTQHMCVYNIFRKDHNQDISWFTNKNSCVPFLHVSLSLWHTHINERVRTQNLLWFLNPTPACQSSVPTRCLLILYKRRQALRWTGDTSLTQQTSTWCVNTCRATDIDSSVYTPAWSKQELIIVYTLLTNRLSISGKTIYWLWTTDRYSIRHLAAMLKPVAAEVHT